MTEDRVIMLAVVVLTVAVVVYLIVSAWQAHRATGQLLDEARLALTRLGMANE